MAMMKKQHFNPQPLFLFSFAAFLCPIIVTAGFQVSLDWESGLDEELYNLQSEPTFYKFIGLRLGFFSSHPAFCYSHSCIYYFGTCVYFAKVTDKRQQISLRQFTTWRGLDKGVHNLWINIGTEDLNGKKSIGNLDLLPSLSKRQRIPLTVLSIALPSSKPPYPPLWRHNFQPLLAF